MCGVVVAVISTIPFYHAPTFYATVAMAPVLQGTGKLNIEILAPSTAAQGGVCGTPCSQPSCPARLPNAIDADCALRLLRIVRANDLQMERTR